MTQREFERTIHTDLPAGESYADYLRLDLVLSAQQRRTEPPQHDEMLFIVQHQVSELWMKLMLHELDAALALIKSDQLDPCFKIFARIAQVQNQLFDAWSVLETMTPYEYLQFRESLGRSSGFQSFQYRGIEFMLGNKDANALLPFQNDSARKMWLQQRLEQPSMYDEFLRYLKRHGHSVPDDRLQRDFTKAYEKSAGVMDVFQRIYEDPESQWNAYEMCEKLVDVEQRFSLWRFRHLKTVHRIIGQKPGTGGSSGVSFLKKAIDLTFFPELWDVRTELKSPKS